MPMPGRASPLIPGADGTDENRIDLAARASLKDGPSQMSDHALLSTLEETIRLDSAVACARGGRQHV